MRLSKQKIIFLGVVSGVAVMFAAFGFNSFEINNHMTDIPLTGIHHLADGYAFLLFGMQNPTISVSKGSVVVIYLQNDDSSIDSMDFNINDLNIHSNQVSYGQTQQIEFVADKTGVFDYYSKIHPDMNGTIIVYDQATRWSSQIKNPME